MSGLCGWFSGARDPRVDPRVISEMSETITRFDGSTVRSAAAISGALAASGETDVFEGDGRMAAVWGRPRWTGPELTEVARGHGIARAFTQSYAERGTAALATLAGSFAVALFDANRGEALLAIDRIGARPLCWTLADGALVFGSSLDAISAFPAAQAKVDRQAIYDYVYFHMIPGPQTINEGRQRLLPGTFLRWRDGRVESGSWWQMQYAEDDARPFPELKETFLGILRESVRQAAGDATAGAFLSGGTDSSTIAGMLGEVTGEPARTYSIGFEAQGYDEMDYARIAARHFGTRHHEYYVTPDDVVSAIPRIAAIHDQPFGNSSAVPTFYCAQLAREDGVELLLGGDGGDELFGGNSRYATQHIYSLYSDLPRFLRKGLIEPVAFLPPGIGIVGKVQRYIRTASMPMPARYDNYNLLERLGPATVFTAAFLADIDRGRPSAQVDEAYRDTRARSLINRMLALDLRYTLADNDLPKVTRSCELARVRIAFPMLSDELLAFSARLQPGLKLKRTRLRYFFKEALRGFLPDEIITKSKHGFGLPIGPWLQMHPPLRQLALDSLADLKKRDIVRADFLDQLTGARVAEHAGYYGTLVWVLVMLEQWLQQHKVVV